MAATVISINRPRTHPAAVAAGLIAAAEALEAIARRMRSDAEAVTAGTLASDDAFCAGRTAKYTASESIDRAIPIEMETGTVRDKTSRLSLAA